MSKKVRIEGEEEKGTRIPLRQVRKAPQMSRITPWPFRARYLLLLHNQGSECWGCAILSSIDSAVKAL